MYISDTFDSGSIAMLTTYPLGPYSCQLKYRGLSRRRPHIENASTGLSWHHYQTFQREKEDDHERIYLLRQSGYRMSRSGGIGDRLPALYIVPSNSTSIILLQCLYLPMSMNPH
jgi:hypothetical protein